MAGKGEKKPLIRGVLLLTILLPLAAYGAPCIPLAVGDRFSNEEQTEGLCFDLTFPSGGTVFLLFEAGGWEDEYCGIAQWEDSPDDYFLICRMTVIKARGNPGGVRRLEIMAPPLPSRFSVEVKDPDLWPPVLPPDTQIRGRNSSDEDFTVYRVPTPAGRSLHLSLEEVESGLKHYLRLEAGAIPCVSSQSCSGFLLQGEEREKNFVFPLTDREEYFVCVFGYGPFNLTAYLADSEPVPSAKPGETVSVTAYRPEEAFFFRLEPVPDGNLFVFHRGGYMIRSWFFRSGGPASPGKWDIARRMDRDFAALELDLSGLEPTYLTVIVPTQGYDSWPAPVTSSFRVESGRTWKPLRYGERKEAQLDFDSPCLYLRLRKTRPGDYLFVRCEDKVDLFLRRDHLPTEQGYDAHFGGCLSFEAPVPESEGDVFVVLSRDPGVRETKVHVELLNRVESGGVRFRRGDVNADGRLDIADTVATLEYLFGSRENLPCPDAADANDSGAIDISDPIRLLMRCFPLGDPEVPCQDRLPAPFLECGLDPSPDNLTCLHFAPCE